MQEKKECEPWHELKDARLRAGLTQTAVAAKLGMATQQYSRYEAGKADPMNVTLGTAIKLADVLGVTVQDLISGRRKSRKS